MTVTPPHTWSPLAVGMGVQTHAETCCIFNQHVLRQVGMCGCCNLRKNLVSEKRRLMEEVRKLRDTFNVFKPSNTSKRPFSSSNLVIITHTASHRGTQSRPPPKDQRHDRVGGHPLPRQGRRDPPPPLALVRVCCCSAAYQHSGNFSRWVWHGPTHTHTLGPHTDPRARSLQESVCEEEDAHAGTKTNAPIMINSWFWQLTLHMLHNTAKRNNTSTKAMPTRFAGGWSWGGGFWGWRALTLTFHAHNCVLQCVRYISLRHTL